MGWDGDGGWGCSAGLRAVPECALRVPPGCARTERCAELRCGAMEAERRRRPAVRGQPGGGGRDDRSATKRSDRTGPPHRPTPPHFGPHSIARAEICLRGGAGPKSGRERRRCPAGCVRAWGAPVVPEVMELWGWEMSA